MKFLLGFPSFERILGALGEHKDILMFLPPETGVTSFSSLKNTEFPFS